MLSFLWYKIKKAKYYALAVLLIALVLGASPYLVAGIVILSVGFDKIIDLIG